MRPLPTKCLAALALLLLPTLTTAQSTPPSPFSQGTQDFTLSASYAIPTLSDRETYYSAGVSYGYYFADRLSINPGLTAHYVHADAETDIVGGDFSLLLRWHFLQQDRWSIFVDGGPGVSYFDHYFPPARDQFGNSGTNFNFILQGGLGATYRLEENLHLLAGARFMHVSNAGLHGPDRHPGSNAVAFYLGLLWTF